MTGRIDVIGSCVNDLLIILTANGYDVKVVANASKTFNEDYCSVFYTEHNFDDEVPFP